MGMHVFNRQHRVWEEEKLLGYDLKLIFTHCTKGLLNFHTKSALWLNAQFREYKQNMHLLQDYLLIRQTCKNKEIFQN